MRSLLVAGAIILAPALAAAQDFVDAEPDRRVQVQLNGGLGGYFGGVNDVTNTGPAYGVHAAFNQTPLLSYELGYTGHTNDIVGEGNGRLNSNKIQAGIKVGPELNLPIPWRPYGFAGLGADFVLAGANTVGLSNAILGVVPFGAGADFFTDSPIQVGARATYDWTPGVGGEVYVGDPQPNGWSAALTAQAAF
jgi:hypothetical protein